MDLKNIEEINRALEEAQKQAKDTYNKLDLDEKFNNWFNDLDGATKMDIYKMYQLNQLDYDE